MSSKSEWMFSLRQNATPLKWHQLHSSQQEALSKAVRVISSYANMGLNYEDEKHLHPHLQGNKLANLAFISGSRGSGKSSVLLSLIQTTYKRDSLGKWLGKPEETQESNFKNLEAAHSALMGKCEPIWLSPLDLELLPKSSNMLAAILARIEQAFKGIAPDKAKGTHEYLLFPQSQKNNPMTRFQKLLSDVSLGWDSELIKRRTVDPDTYSQELLRTERARLEMSTFDALLKDMAEFYQQHSPDHKEPLFLLPVDDADLNPNRYFEFFRLTRMLPARNLFFIVAGNYENLKDLFEMGFLSDFQELTDGFGINKDYPHHRIMKLSSTLGYAARHKTIPGGAHLIEIVSFTAKEAANFKPGSLLSSDHPDKNVTLRELLEKITLPGENDKEVYRDYLKPCKNLWQLITHQFPSVETSTKEENNSSSNSKDYAYTSEIIAGPPRAIFDIWLDLSVLYKKYFNTENINVQTRLEEIIQYFLSCFQESIHSEPALSYKTKEFLQSIFYSVGGKPDLFNQNENIQIRSTSLPRLYEGFKEVYMSTCVLRKVNPFCIIINKAKSEEKNTDNFINDFRASYVFLLHDLMLLNPGNNISRFDFRPAISGWVATSYFSEPISSQLLDWPTIDWLTFYEAEELRLNWNNFLSQLDQSNFSLEEIAYAWIYFHQKLIISDNGSQIDIGNIYKNSEELVKDTIIIFNFKEDKKLEDVFSQDEEISPEDQPEENKLDNIDNKIEIDENFKSERFNYYRYQWRVILLVLLSPEYGLPIEFTNQILTNEVFNSFLGRMEIDSDYKKPHTNDQIASIIHKRAEILIEKHISSEAKIEALSEWGRHYENSNDPVEDSFSFKAHIYELGKTSPIKGLDFSKVLKKAEQILTKKNESNKKESHSDLLGLFLKELIKVTKINPPVEKKTDKKV
ncbi:MAG: hypothetical protein IV090_01145 [Candidatus Sericytochromatia bacterium]|nr:hypothetical protein [Candidatus Sericytochromatia bacterium]